MSTADRNPFWQAQASRARQAAEESRYYWIGLGVSLAEQVRAQIEKYPDMREYIAKCARDSVNLASSNDLTKKRLIAEGFKTRMEQYGERCNA